MNYEQKQRRLKNLNMTNEGAGIPERAQDRYSEDAIGIRDLWWTLVSRKKIVLGIFLVAILATVALIFSMKPLYESKAVMEIGQIGKVGIIESPKSLVERLRQEYRVNDDTEGEQKPPYLNAVSLISGEGPSNVVEFSARAYSAKSAAQFLGGVVDKIENSHRQLYDAALDLKRAQLNSLGTELTALDEQLGSLTERVESLSAGSAAEAAILTLEKSRLLAAKPELESQRADLELSLSDLQSRPTRMLRKPTVPVSPVTPKTVLFLALAAIVGLLAGVSVAFFLEFVSKGPAPTPVSGRTSAASETQDRVSGSEKYRVREEG